MKATTELVVPIQFSVIPEH